MKKNKTTEQVYDKIIALDLGTTSGVAKLYKDQITTSFFTTQSYLTFGFNVKELIDSFKPNIIVCSQTNSFGHFNASRKMHMLFGITCYIAESRGLPVVELNDSQARKNVLGKGYKKEQAHYHFINMHPEYKSKTSDELDAIILAKCWQILAREKTE